MRIVLMFLLGWIVTLAPVWPHQVPTFWFWGALSGSALAFAVILARRLDPQRYSGQMVAGCAILISLATLFDFWRLPPAFILAQCRASGSAGLASDLARHVETHWSWFLGTNVAMLVWIWIMPIPAVPAGVAAVAPVPSAGRNDAAAHFMLRQLLPRLALSLLMFASMALTMTMFESLARRMNIRMSADALVSAMLCGMALYHLLMQLLGALPHLWRRSIGRRAQRLPSDRSIST